MIYIEPSDTFCKRYLNTFRPEGQTLFCYIHEKFEHVFLKSYMSPHEYTMLKGDDKISFSKNHCSLDMHALMIDITREMSKVHQAYADTLSTTDSTQLWNKFFKYIDSLSEETSIIEIIDARLPSYTISGWKLEDKIIDYLQTFINFDPKIVQIDIDSKQKSFWKHLTANKGIIIDGYIYPINSLLYYEEFIGKATPSTRLLQEESKYELVDLGNRAIEIDAYNRFSINGFSEIKIKLQ